MFRGTLVGEQSCKKTLQCWNKRQSSCKSRRGWGSNPAVEMTKNVKKSRDVTVS